SRYRSMIINPPGTHMALRLNWNSRVVPLVLSLLVATVSSKAHAQDEPGTRITVNAAEIAIAGRVQAQLNTSDVDDVQEAEMILRRVRLGANVRVNDLVSGRVHADFAGNRVSIADAYM